MSDKKTILQIIPCTAEVYASFSQDKSTFSDRLVALALVEYDVGDGTYRTIEGVSVSTTEISLCEDSSNFAGYKVPGDS